MALLAQVAEVVLNLIETEFECNSRKGFQSNKNTITNERWKYIIENLALIVQSQASYCMYLPK